MASLLVILKVYFEWSYYFENEDLKELSRLRAVSKDVGKLMTATLMVSSRGVFKPIENFTIMPTFLTRFALVKSERDIAGISSSHKDILRGVSLRLRSPVWRVDQLLSCFSYIPVVIVSITEKRSLPALITLPDLVQAFHLAFGSGDVFLGESRYLTTLTIKATINSGLFFQAALPPLTSLSVDNIDREWDDLPLTLTRLQIGGGFNKPLDNLPERLSYLHISSPNFNCPIDHLPISLLALRIGKMELVVKLKEQSTFNRSVDHLPPALQSLWINGIFNCSIDWLPSNLKSLTIIGSFSHGVNHLPNLLTLRLGDQFHHTLQWIPSTIKKLRTCVGPDSNLLMATCAPTHLTLFLSPKLRQPIPHVPSSTQKVTLLGAFYGPKSYDGVLELDTYYLAMAYPGIALFVQPTLSALPATITKLTLPWWFNLPVHVPDALEHLAVGDNYNQLLVGLPPSLRVLEFRAVHTWNKYDLPLVLPPQLERLSFLGESVFNHPLDDLPLTLRSLRFGDEDPLDKDLGVLNPWLFHVGIAFSHPLRNLPLQLRDLALGENCMVDDCLLPPSLALLTLHDHLHRPLHTSAEVTYRNN